MSLIHILFKEILRIHSHRCVLLAKKKPLKKKTVKKPAKKPAVKKAAKPAAKKPVARPAVKKPAAKPAMKKQGPLVVTPKLRRIWLKVRRTYNISLSAFSNALSSLSDEDANMLYELVRLSLFKANPAQIIQAHPKMREFVHNDDDRTCMHDIYEHLSWRLRRTEPMPKDRVLISKFRKAVKGSIMP